MRRLILVAGLAITVGAALSACSDESSGPFILPVHEKNVSQFDGGGEPAIAVDPTNRQRMVAIDMQIDVDAILSGKKPGPTGGVWRSNDGGQTWQGGGELPITDPINTMYEDPTIAWGPDGTLYGGGHARVPQTSGGVDQALRAINHWRVVRSTDGGLTWNTLTDLMANDRVTQDFDGQPNVARPVRGWTFVDESTGTVYAEMPVLGTPTSGMFLFVSTDRGLTWSTRPRHIGLDTASDAAHGVLATVFDGPVPTTGFSTSSDEGQTWSAGKPAPADTFLRADPSRRGRYAVMQETTSSMNVWVTEDSGDTWSGPVKLVEQSTSSNPQRNKPWIDYGPTGVLAVMWKTNHLDLAPPGGAASQNGIFDTWAAVSFNGGHTFGPPLRLSSALSGAPDKNTQPGSYLCWSLPVCADDFSYLAVDEANVHVVWGDQRTSATDPTPTKRSMYYARITFAF
jgi:hypothetical protein